MNNPAVQTEPRMAWLLGMKNSHTLSLGVWWCLATFYTSHPEYRCNMLLKLVYGKPFCFANASLQLLLGFLCSLASHRKQSIVACKPWFAGVITSKSLALLVWQCWLGQHCHMDWPGKNRWMTSHWWQKVPASLLLMFKTSTDKKQMLTCFTPWVLGHNIPLIGSQLFNLHSTQLHITAGANQ